MTEAKTLQSPRPSCFLRVPEGGVICKGPGENTKKSCQLCLQNLSQICPLLLLPLPGPAPSSPTWANALPPSPPIVCPHPYEHRDHIPSLLCPLPLPWGKSPSPPLPQPIRSCRTCPCPSLPSPHSLTCSNHNGLLTISPTNRYGPAPGPLHWLFPCLDLSASRFNGNVITWLRTIR